MKKFQPKLPAFLYSHKNNGQVLLKQEETLKAFAVLTTALLAVVIITFQGLSVIKSNLTGELIAYSPLLVNILMLVLAYKGKYKWSLICMFFVVPALMVVVSLDNPEINYSRTIIVYLIALFFLVNNRKSKIVYFLFLTAVFVFVRGRSYYILNGEILNFEIVMMPVTILVLFLIFSRIKKEFTLYQKEVRLQNEVLQRKNESLESLVTFSEQQRNKLKRAVLLKERLISVISHDVRVPLNSFKMLINNYEKGYMNEQMVINGIVETKKDLMQIDKMVMDLVNWSRSETTGKTEKLITRDGFIKILDSVLSIYTLCAKNKGLTIIPHVGIPKDMCLSIPRRDLEIVLRNLVSNAIKFSNPNSEILVELAMENGKDSSSAVLSVKDFGVGIHPSILGRLNGRRVASTIGTFDEVGLGVGLSIVFDVINNHSLPYNIESKMEEGARFSLHLPLVSA